MSFEAIFENTECRCSSNIRQQIVSRRRTSDA